MLFFGRKHKALFKCIFCHYSQKEFYYDINYCPKCGKPSYNWQSTINNYLNCMQYSRFLSKAVIQFKKFEYESAARTSLILLEEYIRNRSKSKSYGVNLITQAFSYKLDDKNKVIQRPKISINRLSSEEDRNEHDGIRMLCTGFFKGVRNIIAHHSADLPPSICVSTLAISFFLMEIIENGSIKKERTAKVKRIQIIKSNKIK